jgi:hypothetical protein
LVPSIASLSRQRTIIGVIFEPRMVVTTLVGLFAQKKKNQKQEKSRNQLKDKNQEKTNNYMYLCLLKSLSSFTKSFVILKKMIAFQFSGNSAL